MGPGFEGLSMITIWVKVRAGFSDILHHAVGEMARRARGGGDIIDVACRCAPTNLLVPPNPPCGGTPLRRRKLLASPRRCVGGTGERFSVAVQTVDLG